jgi:putative mRNA 3-end processing factor
MFSACLRLYTLPLCPPAPPPLIPRGGPPILLAYAIGKSQEIIKFLGNRGFRIRAHKSICEVLEIYSQFGVEFQNVSAFTGSFAKGEVGVFPPQSLRRGELRHVSPRSSAILTGWALDPAVIGRRADVAFALSDHADFAALLRCAKESSASEVITHHGFARELAQELRKHGIAARAIGQGLQLDFFGPPKVTGRRRAA